MIIRTKICIGITSTSMLTNTDGADTKFRPSETNRVGTQICQTEQSRILQKEAEHGQAEPIRNLPRRGLGPRRLYGARGLLDGPFVVLHRSQVVMCPITIHAKTLEGMHKK